MKGHVNKCRKARGRENDKMVVIDLEYENRRARVEIYYENSPNFKVYRPNIHKSKRAKNKGAKCDDR